MRLPTGSDDSGILSAQKTSGPAELWKQKSGAPWRDNEEILDECCGALQQLAGNEARLWPLRGKAFLVGSNAIDERTVNAARFWLELFRVSSWIAFQLASAILVAEPFRHQRLLRRARQTFTFRCGPITKRFLIV